MPTIEDTIADKVIDQLLPQFKTLLAEAIKEGIQNTPIEPPVTPPVEEPPKEPEGQTFSLYNASGKEWVNGLSVLANRFIVRATDDTRAALVEGAEVQFSDGSTRLIGTRGDSDNVLYVNYTGDRVDATKVTPTIKVTTNTNGEATPTPPVEIPKPEEPKPEVPKSGSLPIAGMNVAGMGNNPWLASINGIGNDKIGTHYRGVEEKTIREYVKDLKEGESWIARIDVALERFVDSNNMALNEKYVKEVTAAIDLIHKYKGKVIIDVHNYMRFWKKVPAPIAGRYNQSVNNHLGNGHAVWTVIGEPDSPISVAGFANFWKRMAQQFKNHPAILGYGLSNEPHNRGDDGVDVNSKWPTVAQACINSIREDDMNTFIMVGGNFYSSAKMWTRVSTALGNLKDPADKIVFEAHQYMDKKGDGGGRWDSQTDPVSADQGTKDWANWFKWLEANNFMGYCGEVGGPATAGELNKALENLFAEFYKRRIPWTQWRAGAGFSDNYANGMNRTDGSLKDNSQPLMKYIGKTVEAYGPRK